jgi:CBS domain-containing protein
METRLPANTPLSVLLRRPAAVVFEDSSLRQAADHMVREDVGRLPVVSREQPDVVIGILTRSDLLAAQSRRLEEGQKRRHIQLRRVSPSR